MISHFKSITPGAHLSDRVADALAAEIRAGRLVAGDKLPTEAVLVEQFSVSRTVVREAVSRLKSLGLVDSRQAITALEKAVQAGGDGVSEDVSFHRAIAEAARNPFLIGTLEYLGQFLQGSTRVTRANEARRADFARQVADEHQQISQAIEAGDVAAARRSAARHMDNAIKRIEQADPVFWQEEGVQLARPLVTGLRPNT